MKLVYMLAAAIAMFAAASLAPPAYAAAACAGPCASVEVTCPTGAIISGPAAQTNLLVASCGEQQVAQKKKVKKAKTMVAAKPISPFVGPVPRPVALTGDQDAWVTPTVPPGCDVGQSRPAVDLGQGLTLTCDSQGPVRRGWNVKALGSSEPVRLNGVPGQRCILRFGGGASIACQVRIKAYKATAEGFIFRSEKGEQYKVTKSFGGWSADKL